MLGIVLGPRKKGLEIKLSKSFDCLALLGGRTPKLVCRAVERDDEYHSCCAEPSEGWISCCLSVVRIKLHVLFSGCRPVGGPWFSGRKDRNDRRYESFIQLFSTLRRQARQFLHLRLRCPGSARRCRLPRCSSFPEGRCPWSVKVPANARLSTSERP